MLRTYGLLSLEDAVEELIKLIIFDKVKYPVLAAKDSKVIHETIIPKLLERADHIELFPEVYVNKRLIKFPNGVQLREFDSTYADGVRGFNYDLVWMHDRGLWHHPSDFRDMLMLGLRLGEYQTILESKGD